MDEKKPSTADILAKIRAQKAAEAASAAPADTPAPAAAATPATPAAATPAPAAAPAGAKPSSTKDILAAIRAKAAGGTPAAPAASAPAAAAVAPAAAGVKAAGPLPSVQDMLKAVREGKPVGVATGGVAAGAVATADAAGAKPAKVAPPMPQKPVAAAGSKGKPAPARRGLAMYVLVGLLSLVLFGIGVATNSPWPMLAAGAIWSVVMSPVALAWTSLIGVTTAWTLGVARFMFPNVLVEPPSKFKVGPISDYPPNSVSNRWKDQFGIWVVHSDQYGGRDMIYALATVCTHLGCTPSWLDGEQKFKCPCHGSGFYVTGVNFEGPAPRPLERMGIRISEDGMLEVDKSVKFQEEMGQWTDPSCYVEVS